MGLEIDTPLWLEEPYPVNTEWEATHTVDWRDAAGVSLLVLIFVTRAIYWSRASLVGFWRDVGWPLRNGRAGANVMTFGTCQASTGPVLLAPWKHL